MISNYIKTAWRNISRDFSYSLINILGLAAGLASFVIILLYLNYELSYDKWDPELKKVYRVSVQINNDILQETNAPLAAFIAQKYYNAEAATHLMSAGDYKILLSNNNKKIYQKDILTVDSLFLKVFPYKLIQGDPKTALNQPNAAILSEEVAHKLFGDEDPIGKTIKVYNSSVCIITGVMQEPSGPTHLIAKMLMRDPYEKSNNFWGNFSFQTYIKLKSPSTNTQLEDGINRIYYADHLKKDNLSYEAYQKKSQHTSLFVDAVADIHNFPSNGSTNFSTVTILLLLAVLLLLAGAINFSNLAIAKSMRRAKEVGVRKVLGSNRKQLIFQFMIETALQCTISLCIAVLVIGLALPIINESFNITLTFWGQGNTLTVIAEIAACLLAVTLLSGLYPSFFLSRFNTTKVLKGDYSSGKSGTMFRNVLIVVQFMVSVFFIISILVIKSQMNFMQNTDKGFSGQQVMRIETSQHTREQGFATMRDQLLELPGVSYVAKTTKVPGDVLFVDTSTIAFKYAGKEYRMASIKISKDYFKTLSVPLIAGRMFTDEVGDQKTRTGIINETAAKKLNLSDPIGKLITFPSCDSVPVKIVGVVKDFNTLGFEHAVQPEVYTMGNNACMFQSGGAVLVKISSDHLQGSVAAIEQQWKKIEPDFPIQYSFIDDNFQRLFISYNRLQQIIAFFTTVAITISVMGLFALTAFFCRRRSKEISVRKVLGATVSQLAFMLSKEFVYLILVSVLIITPLGWWAMEKWLQTFAYHIKLGGWIFLAAAILSICIALLTISFQAIRTAVSNPVKSLRSE